MNLFDQALQLVQDTLARQREQTAPRGAGASRASLRRLADAARQNPLQKEKEAGPSFRREQPATPEGVPLTAKGLAARVRAAMEANAAPVPPTPAPAPPRPAPADEIPPARQVSAPAAFDAGTADGSKEERMERLRERVFAALADEPLAHNRTRYVFGVGNVDAELMFVGEAPGADEEIAGEPFVGKAGQLLTKIIEAMSLRRGEVYIANVLKWRPDMPEGESGNRKPRPDEMAACLPYLVKQIEIIQPKCIVGLGATAMEGLIGASAPMRELRGRWHSFKGIPLMATYHPAYLLRNQSMAEKRKVWEDMLQVLELLGKPISAKQRGYFLSKGS